MMTPLPLAAALSPNYEAIAAAAMLLGVLLIGYAYRRNLLSRWVARAKPDQAPPHATPVAVDPLHADLNELTERLAAQLDQRAERIERLIAQADERIRTLANATAAKGPQTRGLERGSERGLSLSRMPDEVDPSHRDVYDLADEGLTPVEIASRLERPTGQVELILNLRRGTMSMR